MIISISRNRFNLHQWAKILPKIYLLYKNILVETIVKANMINTWLF